MRKIYGSIKYCFSTCNLKETFLLQERIRQESLCDWQLIQILQYEDYIWWSYPNFKLNKKFNSFDQSLALKRNNGTPSCIIRIVQLVNEITAFTPEIREYVSIYYPNLFTYYDRYYRYLRNDRVFGHKKFLSQKHGHKLHFISCIRHREIFGKRLNKNHLCF